MARVPVNGIELNIEVEGTGQPVLLLHGLGSSIASLAAERALLRHARRVVAIDCRGHGASSKPSAFTIDDHVADLLGLMDALGLERADLLGRSMGSYIAQGAASRAPQRFGRLMLVVPRAHSAESSATRLRRRLASELDGRSPDQQRRILLAAMLAPGTPDRTARLLAAMGTPHATPLSAPEEAAAAKAIEAFDLRADLPRISAHTLVVSGRHDWLNPPSEGALIAALIPAASHVILEHSGHLPAIEQRDDYLGLVASFLMEPRPWPGDTGDASAT